MLPVGDLGANMMIFGIEIMELIKYKGYFKILAVKMLQGDTTWE